VIGADRPAQRLGSAFAGRARICQAPVSGCLARSTVRFREVM
jgi:hypothetical protein